MTSHEQSLYDNIVHGLRAGGWERGDAEGEALERIERLRQAPKGKFHDFIHDLDTDDAVEQRGDRFFIKIGFAGCNTHANNRNGYATKQKAESVILDYQNRR